MPLRLGFCLSFAEAARESEAERLLEQHAAVFARGTTSFGRREQVKAEKQNHLQKCMPLQLGFCFIFGCCLRACKAARKSEVKWFPKQHGYGVP